MTYRVIQWATGLVGQESIKGIVAHPELELVGCWVHSESKVGRDAGDIAGIPPTGVLATNSLDEICAIEADAVVYSPMLADEGEILALLRSGKNVVTPIGYIFPRPGPRTDEVEAACRAAERHAARHRRASRRHHRAVPADPQRALPRTSGTCAWRSSPTSATTQPRAWCGT